MSKTDLKLLGSWASPFATRVQVALKLKSIEYEFVEENLYAAGKSERLLKANPVHKKVPVLIHEEKPICESLIIIQYIDESWTDGPSLLPSDTYDRATARFWAAYIDEKWFVAFKELEKASGDEERATVIAKIYECLALLEEAFVKSSKGGDFFGGEQVGYVDTVLGSYLGWMKVTELMAGLKLLDETKTPGLAKWAERFSSHDTFKDVLPEPQKLIEFYMMIQAAKASS